MEIVPSMSDTKAGVWRAPESLTLQPHHWASININGAPAYLERLNLPDLDELDKKYCYMQSDLVENYKRAALEAADPSTYSLDEDYGDYHDALHQGGISQVDILAQAQSIFSAKFPKFANRRVNRKPAVRFKPRWNSSTDVDNMNQLADDVEQPAELPAPKRGRKPKAVADVEKPEQSEPPKRGRKPKAVKIVNKSEQHEPPKRGRKRKAVDVDDIEVLADAATLESPSDVRKVKRLRADSDKENESVPKRKDSGINSMPYRLTESVRKPLPPAMNMSRKRTVKESDVSSAGYTKRMKYDTQQAVTEAAQSPAAQEITSLSENRSPPAQKISFARPESQASRGPAHTESSKTVAIQRDSKHLRRHSPTYSFSEDGALFEELLNQQVDDDDDEQVVRDVFMEDPSGNPHTLTPSSTISVLSPATATQQATISVPTTTIDPVSTASSPTSQPQVQPSVRGKPPSMADESSNVPGTQPEGRIITCFRVAEALRIRSNAITAAIPISDSLKSSAPITIELFARIHLTYRECVTQVFVFEDVFFPNRLPVLRAIHQSWRRCEEEAQVLLRHNPQQPVEGGFLCRAVVELDTNLPKNLSDPLQGEVTSVRVAEWSEIKRVRGIVDPKDQEE